MALKDSYSTISEAAKELGVARQTISRWISDGKIKAEKIGRETIISKVELKMYRSVVWAETVREHIRRRILESHIGSMNYEDVRKYRLEVMEQPFAFDIRLYEPIAVRAEYLKTGKVGIVLTNVGRIQVGKGDKPSVSFYPMGKRWDLREIPEGDYIRDEVQEDTLADIEKDRGVVP